MEDETGSGDETLIVTRRPPIKLPPVEVDQDFVPDGPVCPFRCQCHLRVSQCSDLGKHFMTLD